MFKLLMIECVYTLLEKAIAVEKALGNCLSKQKAATAKGPSEVKQLPFAQDRATFERNFPKVASINFVPIT